MSFVQKSWKQALCLECIQKAAKDRSQSLGPSGSGMGHSGVWKWDRGPTVWIRIVRSQWEVDKEGSAVGLGGLAASHTLGHAPSPMFCAHLIGNFWEVRVGLQVSKDIVGIPTTQVAEASVDPQHLAGEARPVGTLEGDVDGLGLVGDAAPAVCAHSTVLRPVGACAGAAGEGEVHGCLRLVHGQTLLPFLQKRKKVPAGMLRG